MRPQFMKAAAAAVMCLALGGCIFGPGSGSRTHRPVSFEGVWVDRVAHGSGFERDLSRAVEREMVQALGTALQDPKSGTQVDWRGGSLELKSFQGSARVSRPFLIGVESAMAARLGAPLDLYTDAVIEPDSIPVRVTTKSNIRLGPDMTFPVATVVDPGTPLTVKGLVKDSEWALVTRGAHELSEVIGYIKGSLLERAERPVRNPIGENELVGGEAFTLDGGREAFDLDMALAGGTNRKPRMCRDFEQTLSVLLGDTLRWNGTACRIKPGHWEVIDRLEQTRPRARPSLDNDAAGD